METAVQFGLIVLPAALVLYAAFLMVRSFLARDADLRKSEVRSRAIETILPARLQAYERMALFLERIAPQNLLVRLNDPNYSARDFQRVLLDEIRNEYNHNVSQQIYMSETVWSHIRNAREDLTVLINDATSQLPPEATGLDLAKRIFELSLQKGVDPIALALAELKKEIQQVF
jgi:hypothetical protein